MSLIKNLAASSNLLFVAAVILGIFLPQAKPLIFVLILPALTILLTVTLLRFPRGFFRHLRKLVPSILLGNLMNYLLLGNVIILGSIFLIRDEKIWIGMILVAAVPSAVHILSLGEKMRADKPLTFAGLAGTYMAAIILIPLIGLAFLKYIPISYEKLIVLVLALVVLPLIFSRIAVDRNWDAAIEKRAGLVTEVCFFIIFYAVASANAQLIKGWPVELLFICAVAILSIVPFVITFFFIHKLHKVPDHALISLLLLGTMKNYGLAGAIALYVFHNETALPALIFATFMFFYSIGLKFMAHRFPAPETAPARLRDPDHI